MGYVYPAEEYENIPYNAGLPRNVQTDSRIINGEDAAAGDFPWQVREILLRNN